MDIKIMIPLLPVFVDIGE